MSELPADARRGVVARVLFGRDDDRVRATWRVLVPLAVAVAIYVAGLLSLQLLQGALADPDAAGTAAVGWTLAVGIAFVLVIGTATAATLLVASRLDRRSPWAYGFERSAAWIRDLCGGVGIGFVASSTMIAALVLTGRSTVAVDPTGVGVESAAVAAVALVVLVAFLLANNVLEEVLFRGVVVTNAAEGLRQRSVGVVPAVAGAVAFSLVPFGLYHLLSGGPALVITSTVAGLYFAAGYVLTGQLALPIGIHFGGIVTGSVQQEVLLGGLTLPSIVVVERAGDAALLVGVATQSLRVLVGVALIAAWVALVHGDLSIDESVHTWLESPA